MSSNNDTSSRTRGHEARDEKTSSMVAKLAKELDGALDLSNTEDVDRKTTYAPAVTKEVVKPVVHEQIEEHITRETHTHDVYTKILPVKDVEVLPARHWVPGPDGRLIQVDEKDVYSGAAWSQGQSSTAGFAQTQQTNLEHMNHGNVDQTRESSSTQFADTVKHTSINQPKVIPGQVKQVYQTQVHQPELDQRYVRVGQVEQDQISHGSHTSSNPVLVSHREVSPGQVHQQDADHHQIPRKPIDQGHSQGYITPLVNQHTADRYTVSENEASSNHANQIRQGQGEEHRHLAAAHENNKYQANQGHDHSLTNRNEGSQGQLHDTQVQEDQSNQGQSYNERSIRQGHHHSVHQGQADDSHVHRASRQPADQHPVEAHQRTEHQTKGDQLSPGLLDPYRVKNGPVHHDPSDPTSKPLPDLPETSVQKIAGHKILTTEDDSGHTRLHKEPKDSKRIFH